MRWTGQQLGVADDAALPGLETIDGLVRSVTTPEFDGITFHEVMSRSALNRVPGSSAMPFSWTINPYRGCTHACAYCFARNTHTYLDFDTGRDFDSQIVVKINVADALRRELRAGSWQHEHVALGTNTDPYQRAEGRYRLMPGIIDALAESGTPFSVLTKGTLIRRDLPTLAAAARRVPVELSFSIAVFDDALQRSLEHGTPTAAARLDTVRAAVDAGFRVTVFLMPVLPYLTDQIATIDHALARIAEAGASRVIYGALHLRPGAKQWFWQWLSQNRPDLISSYERLYPGQSANAPREYRQWLARRVRPLLRAHGLDGGAEEDQPGHDPAEPSIRTGAGPASRWTRRTPAPATAEAVGPKPAPEARLF